MTVGNTNELELQTVAQKGLDDFFVWVHPHADADDLQTIRTEYLLRQRIAPLPPPVEVCQAGQRLAGGYFSGLPGGLAILGAVRALSNHEPLGSWCLTALVRQLYELQPTMLVQAAIDCDDAASHHMLSAAKFWSPTCVDQLCYSWSSLTEPAPSSIEFSQHRWSPASRLSSRRFAQLLGQTFHNTLDCPELNGLRSDRNVLASFLVDRRFRASRLWEVLWDGQQPIGCLLLCPHRDGLVELLYTGLVPAARGKGLGKLLVQRALEVSRACGATSLALAVDVRNSPAIAMYQRSGFMAFRRLRVYLAPGA
ncbi:MAG: GNAT family N-acetyltransferase [Pirellulaceae bacterium]|nr:GNAT family N-acetyltransferase [Pirellulaceae bacterium]